MNQERRKQIEEAKSILESARDDEQEYFDNMPDSLKDGEKGEKAQTAIDALDEAISACETAVEQ